MQSAPRGKVGAAGKDKQSTCGEGGCVDVWMPRTPEAVQTHAIKLGSGILEAWESKFITPCCSVVL